MQMGDENYKVWYILLTHLEDLVVLLLYYMVLYLLVLPDFLIELNLNRYKNGKHF